MSSEREIKLKDRKLFRPSHRCFVGGTRRPGEAEQNATLSKLLRRTRGHKNNH